MAMSENVLRNPYLINNEVDIVVFLGLNVFNLMIHVYSPAVMRKILLREITSKKNSYQNYKR